MNEIKVKASDTVLDKRTRPTIYVLVYWDGAWFTEAHTTKKKRDRAAEYYRDRFQPYCFATILGDKSR